MAETPPGAVLAPVQPGSIQLIQQWFTEIAAIFPGPLMHIGADEPCNVGKGQIKDAVAKEEFGNVYVDFLIQIHHTAEGHDRDCLRVQVAGVS